MIANTTFSPYTVNMLIEALRAHAAADPYLPLPVKMFNEPWKKARSLTILALEQLERDMQS